MARRLTRVSGLVSALILFAGCGGGSGPSAAQPLPTPTFAPGPPSGPVLYVRIAPDSVPGNSGLEQLAAFSLDAAGTPVSVAGSPFRTNGEGDLNVGPGEMVATPDRRHLILAHNKSRTLESFATGSQGQLRSVSVATLTANPSSLALHPNGTLIYALLPDVGSVAVVAIDPVTGLLRESSGSPFPVGSDVRSLAFDPAGGFLTTGHMFGVDRGLRVHSLNTSGAIQSPPVQSRSLTNPRPGGAVAYDRNGELLFMLDLDLGVWVFRVNSGSRTLSLQISVIATGGFSNAFVLHPLQNYIYVARALQPEMRGLSYDANGRLAGVPGSPFALPSARYQNLAMTRAGDRIYLAEREANTLIGFNVSATNGTLTQIGPPVAIPGTTSGSPKISPGDLFVLN